MSDFKSNPGMVVQSKTLYFNFEIWDNKSNDYKDVMNAKNGVVHKFLYNDVWYEADESLFNLVHSLVKQIEPYVKNDFRRIIDNTSDGLLNPPLR